MLKFWCVCAVRRGAITWGSLADDLICSASKMLSVPRCPAQSNKHHYIVAVAVGLYTGPCLRIQQYFPGELEIWPAPMQHNKQLQSSQASFSSSSYYQGSTVNPIHNTSALVTARAALSQLP